MPAAQPATSLLAEMKSDRLHMLALAVIALCELYKCIEYAPCVAVHLLVVGQPL